ncbi:MAG: YgiW/YdeI family stress tolerance OB fold protein [Deltaproteobacteria bacterium]|jgi:uncharacterized protein (TIGR00156 family)|nr:YgiW/YdeI family stress tolerance OB fold protein [Deltaproteobacteria bacterium]
MRISSLFALAFLAALAFMAAPALAQSGFHGPAAPSPQDGANPSGGFTGPGLSAVTVAQALKLSDDSFVILRGNIVQHLGKDRYLFRDDSGEIIIDIDNHKWNGLSVGPENAVEIQGEIDKDWGSLEVDVDRIALIQ